METDDDRLTDHDLIGHLRLRARAEQDGILAIIASRMEAMMGELDIARRLEILRSTPDPEDGTRTSGLTPGASCRG